MKAMLSFLIVASIFLIGCRSTAIVEQSSELGFGFRHVVLAEPVSNSLESVGHFGYFYYRDKRLSQADTYSVSPSGRYAVYQDGPSGNLFLFHRAGRRQIQLTSRFVALVDSFDWHEDSRAVATHFASGHGVQTFELP
jgi:hypothetical protein